MATTTYLRTTTFMVRGYKVLHFAFVVIPIIAGLDKFVKILGDWDKYLSPIISNVIPTQTFMMIIGIVEIVAGFVVLLRPRIGGWIIAAWLAGIIINLLSIPGYYDVALRDFGLMLGAIALSLLSPNDEKP